MAREDMMSQQRLEIVDPANAPPVWAALRNEAEAGTPHGLLDALKRLFQLKD